jgi:hypothetical protein
LVCACWDFFLFFNKLTATYVVLYFF